VARGAGTAARRSQALPAGAPVILAPPPGRRRGAARLAVLADGRWQVGRRARVPAWPRILHMDVSPYNILVSLHADGSLLLNDFGHSEQMMARQQHFECAVEVEKRPI